MDMVSQYLGHNDPWENLFLPLASAYYGVFFLWMNEGDTSLELKNKTFSYSYLLIIP